MTKSEYTAYQLAFQAFMDSEGLANLSCQESECEPFFSWRPCEVCKRPQGGTRHLCNGYNPTTRKVQSDYTVCEDCVYYAEYGQLDDTTMMDMTDDSSDDEEAGPQGPAPAAADLAPGEIESRTAPDGGAPVKWDYIVQSYSGAGYGWEDETAEETRAEGLERLKEYRANSQYAHRLIRRKAED